MRSETIYQYALIGLGVAATSLLGFFLLREIYPEYKIYQNDFVELEKFRSSYTHQPPSPFQVGVKQIVQFPADKGPAIIDRCISCHVALQVEDYSPTKLGRDLNGELILDLEGMPVKVPNEEYVWSKLDRKIAELTDPIVLEQLKKQGDDSEVDARMKEADHLKSLKTAQVGNQSYDVTKVIAMHPLIGKEVRPFEFHSIEEYGCVSCHNGEGLALTTEKAHGPLFDGQYEVEFTGHKPQFIERDPKNDPPFAYLFNNKPGHELLFQTHPLFIGPLIQANCVQCHLSSPEAIESSLSSTINATKRSKSRSSAIQKAFENEKSALISLILLKQGIEKNGLTKVLEKLKISSEDYKLPTIDRTQAASQLKFLDQLVNAAPGHDADSNWVIADLNKAIIAMVGSSKLMSLLEEQIQTNNKTTSVTLANFITQHSQDPEATGTLFAKASAWNVEQELMEHVQDTEISVEKTVNDQQFLNALSSDMDHLLRDYNNGKELYISQACYACHRITGFARGGVGPELTQIGSYYPWYIKGKMVWPQGDLPTSTMPNYHLDHEELEGLMTFLLGQQGANKTTADTAYKIAVQEWEAGKRSAIEKPVTPVQMHDLDYSMTVFATEGCAACHRLKGFVSDVGFAIEKDPSTKPQELDKEHQWFRNLFPELISGSEIVKAIDEHAAEIDLHLQDHVRKDSIIEKIEAKAPGHIEGFYTNFKYANRAKNHSLKQGQLQEWQKRLHRVLMVYIQEYGLGRLVGPRPNWSGIYRSDEWLIEHFRNPSSHVPRSIMPVFPFDDTKFYALTYMLDQLAIRNRDELRSLLDLNGFSPEVVALRLCSQCHGEQLVGNGPVAEWIYPIPKNLRNPAFLRNLTKEQVIASITHGVKGTPMPPWGEIGSDKQNKVKTPVLTTEEIHLLADWLFSVIPGGDVIRSSQDVPKWHYSLEDVMEELNKEGGKLTQ